MQEAARDNGPFWTIIADLYKLATHFSGVWRGNAACMVRDLNIPSHINFIEHFEDLMSASVNPNHLLSLDSEFTVHVQSFHCMKTFCVDIGINLSEYVCLSTLLFHCLGLLCIAISSPSLGGKV